jgi:hypothetical protein
MRAKPSAIVAVSATGLTTFVDRARSASPRNCMARNIRAGSGAQDPLLDGGTSRCLQNMSYVVTLEARLLAAL